MKKQLLVLVLSFTVAPAFASEAQDWLKACEKKVRHSLHVKTARSIVEINDCSVRGEQLVCNGYATNEDAGSKDFVFGIRENCSLSFFRLTAEE